MFIDVLKAVLFGFIEGVTEWLPISSTGHLIILDKLVSIDLSNDFKSTFDVVIQLGAIMAVVVIYWKKLLPLNKNEQGKLKLDKDILTMWFKIVVAIIPSAIIGILLDDIIDKYLYNELTVAIMLISVGVLFIIVENNISNENSKVNSIKDITFGTAFIIGLCQLVSAIFPGTSRSGATIVGALILGVSRSVSAEFTFFLGVPTMFGASLLKILKFGFNFTITETVVLLVGTLVAFLVSILVIKFIIQYVKKHNFKIFGWYRIALGVVVIAYFVFTNFII